ncbi:MAG: NUDIX domain-containing protein [Patescibacteria group bacterium]
MKKNFIPENLYKRIIGFVPICCVDLVVKQGNKFLLVKRVEYPLKNKWWFPGGRVLFGESLNSAVLRKLREETNVKKAKKIKFLGIGELKFKRGQFNGPIHGIVCVFLVEIDKNRTNNVRPDRTSSQVRWFDFIQRNFNSYLKKNLKLAGFK